MNHSEINYYICDLCGFKGKNKALIWSHMRKHCDTSKAVCEFCSIKVWDLKCHYFRVHKSSEAGCYYCKTCDYCFLHRSQFLQHINRCNGPNGKKYPADSVRIPRKELDPSCRIRTL